MELRTRRDLRSESDRRSVLQWSLERKDSDDEKRNSSGFLPNSNSNSIQWASPGMHSVVIIRASSKRLLKGFEHTLTAF